MIVDKESVLFLAGQIAGMAMRAEVTEFQAAAANEGLTPTNRALVACVARFREDLDRVFTREAPLDG